VLTLLSRYLLPFQPFDPAYHDAGRASGLSYPRKELPTVSFCPPPLLPARSAVGPADFRPSLIRLSRREPFHSVIKKKTDPPDLYSSRRRRIGNSQEKGLRLSGYPSCASYESLNDQVRAYQSHLQDEIVPLGLPFEKLFRVILSPNLAPPKA